MRIADEAVVARVLRATSWGACGCTDLGRCWMHRTGALMSDPPARPADDALRTREAWRVDVSEEEILKALAVGARSFVALWTRTHPPAYAAWAEARVASSPQEPRLRDEALAAQQAELMGWLRSLREERRPVRRQAAGTLLAILLALAPAQATSQTRTAPAVNVAEVWDVLADCRAEMAAGGAALEACRSQRARGDRRIASLEEQLLRAAAELDATRAEPKGVPVLVVVAIVVAAAAGGAAAGWALAR